jgi:flavin reductase (DIM6/NTAB) family NADH-FMN oxidoreductase RutF
MKDSARNIQETGEFVINLVPFSMVEAMNVTALDFDAETNEIDLAGLTTLPSTKIATPRIAESPVAFECRTLQAIDLGLDDIGMMRSVVLGTVVAIHISDDAILDAERSHVDTPRLDLIGRMHGGGWYSRTTDRFRLDRLDISDYWETRNSAPE